MNHNCHWPGCAVVVPSHLWGCRRHWFTLPNSLRLRLWQTYEPGATYNSPEYLDAVQAIQDWIQENTR